MREIKFRGRWRDTGKSIPDFMEQYTIDALNAKEFIVEQYTGLKDKNGKEIYEGDVVQVAGKHKYRVEYCVSSEYEYELRAAMFILRANLGGKECGFPFDEFAIPNCIVIGNIYENTELLKEKSDAVNP